MRNEKIEIDGVVMSRSAAEYVRATGTDVAADLRAILHGRPLEDLLAECLNGAEDGGAECVRAWREYVGALKIAREFAAERAARGHLKAIGWKPEDGHSDSALGIGEEAWGGEGAGREWNALCSAAVFCVAVRTIQAHESIPRDEKEPR